MKENVRNSSIKTDGGIKKWKKILAVSGIIILVLFLLCHTVLGIAVKHAVNTAGPLLTGLQMHLESASVYPILGYVKLKGFTLKNPDGYQAPDAVTIRKMVADLDMSSLFSAKKVMSEFTLSGVDVYYEQGLKANNLNDILKTLSGSSEEKKPQDPPSAEPVKLQIDKLRLTDIRLHAVVSFPGKNEVSSSSLPLPPVALDNLGKGTDGMTVSDLASVILKDLLEKIYGSFRQAASKSADAAADALKKAGTGLQDAGKKTFEKTKELFQKVLPPSTK